MSLVCVSRVQAVQPSLITYKQAFPIEFHSKVSLMLDFLITKIYTPLDKSPESSEIRTSKLDAVR